MSKEKYFNQLTPAELERLSLLLEELGEAQQAIGKILRHGYESYHPDATDYGLNNRGNLEKELGDIEFAMELMLKHDDIDICRIQIHQRQKSESVQKYLHHNKGENL